MSWMDRVEEALGGGRILHERRSRRVLRLVGDIALFSQMGSPVLFLMPGGSYLWLAGGGLTLLGSLLYLVSAWPPWAASRETRQLFQPFLLALFILGGITLFLLSLWLLGAATP